MPEDSPALHGESSQTVEAATQLCHRLIGLSNDLLAPNLVQQPEQLLLMIEQREAVLDQLLSYDLIQFASPDKLALQALIKEVENLQQELEQTYQQSRKKLQVQMTHSQSAQQQISHYRADRLDSPHTQSKTI